MAPPKKKVSVSFAGQSQRNSQSRGETSARQLEELGENSATSQGVNETNESNSDVSDRGSRVRLSVSPAPDTTDDTAVAERGGTVRAYPRRGTIMYPLWRKMSTVGSAIGTPQIIKLLRKSRVSIVWIMVVVQGIMVLVSYAINYGTFGSIISQKPVFSWMLGPNVETLMQMGSRFQPCMRAEKILPPDQSSSGVLCYLPSKNGFDGQGPRRCDFDELCLRFISAGDTKDPEEKFTWQWLRFIFPIFLHGGLWHYLMNALIHVTTLRSLEEAWGFWRITLIYMASGVFGFLFGAVFGKPLVSATGSSGAIYGLMACFIIDTTIHWQVLKQPIWRLVKIFGLMALMMLVAVLPGMDNFSHIGGFFIGFLAGLVLMPSIPQLPQRRSIPSSLLVSPVVTGVLVIFIRCASFAALIYAFYALKNAFYDRTGPRLCSWCSALECISIFGSCNLRF